MRLQQGEPPEEVTSMKEMVDVPEKARGGHKFLILERTSWFGLALTKGFAFGATKGNALSSQG